MNLGMSDEERAVAHDQTWIEKARNPALLWDIIADLFDEAECATDLDDRCVVHGWTADRPCPHGRIRLLVANYGRELAEKLAAISESLLALAPDEPSSYAEDQARIISETGAW